MWDNNALNMQATLSWCDFKEWVEGLFFTVEHVTQGEAKRYFGIYKNLDS